MPPAPKLLTALNMPTVQKHVKPSNTIWVIGRVYHDGRARTGMASKGTRTRSWEKRGKALEYSYLNEGD